MNDFNYITYQTRNAQIKAWIKGVPIEDGAKHQLYNTAELPIV